MLNPKLNMKTNLEKNKNIENGNTNLEDFQWMSIYRQEYCDTYSECSEEEWEIFKMETYLRRLRTKISDD